jgi:hypothetical protein
LIYRQTQIFIFGKFNKFKIIFGFGGKISFKELFFLIYRQTQIFIFGKFNKFKIIFGFGGKISFKELFFLIYRQTQIFIFGKLSTRAKIFKKSCIIYFLNPQGIEKIFIF